MIHCKSKEEYFPTSYIPHCIRIPGHCIAQQSGGCRDQTHWYWEVVNIRDIPSWLFKQQIICLTMRFLGF